MRFEERELNEYELVLLAIDEAKEAGKRIDKIFMSQAEFDTFYQLAMNHLPASETASLMNRKLVYGAQIIIEENPTKRTRKEKQNADSK